MMVERLGRFVIAVVYALSPYRWLDRVLEWLEKRARTRDEHGKAGRIRRRRYLFSELYILGWLPVGVALLVFHGLVPALVAGLAGARVLGILNKELCVVLYAGCKITEGKAVSPAGRVLTLALYNYMTATVLMAFIYVKVGSFAPARHAALPEALAAFLQACTMSFTLSLAYEPLTEATRAMTIAHAAFSFLFAAIILGMFVSLVGLRAEEGEREGARGA